jgi:hypothetical protein
MNQKPLAPKELTDCTDAFESGISVVSAPTPPPSSGVLPRLHTSPDREGSATTLMTDLVEDLARLSNLFAIPRLTRPVDRSVSLTPREAYVASLIGRDVSLATLLDLSPMSEDDTLHFLARLITLGIARISPRAE